MTLSNNPVAPVLISAPLIAQPKRDYGIFSVALGPMPFPAAEGEGFGLEYVPDTCVGNYQLYNINCPSVSGSKTFSGIDATVSGNPFAVIVSYTCGAIGWSFDEVEQRLRTRMSLREQQAVEQRIWQGSTGTGALGQMPGLFRGATSLGTASCVTEATEMLEQALADNSVTNGLIHARPGVNAHMATAKLLKDGPGRTLTTWYGTPIAFGQGYDGTGPNGEATDTDKEYMYASGRVLVWQSADVNIPPIGQTMNRSSNQITAFAERTYAVAVECGVWTVQVTRNCTTAT